MVSPVHGDYRRCQAEIPLIVLFRFPGPALFLRGALLAAILQSARTMQQFMNANVLERRLRTRGFPATHFPDFGLCRRSRILEAIFGALSLHPKIPFPAAGIEFRTDNGVPFAT
jgi:hypothetical protein